MISYENTSPEVAAAKPEIALFPIGALEQHSSHLPLATDSIIAHHLSRLLAEKLNAFLLPVLPISNSQEHQDFFGTVWIQPDTLARVITDVCAALKHHGFRKIVILSVHGGNWIIKPTVRRINLSDPDITVITAPLEAGPMSPWSEPGQVHACRNETSCILHLHPDLVKALPADFIPTVPRDYPDYVGMKGCTPTGVWGSPSAASPELGAKLLDQAADALAEHVRKTFDYIAHNRPGTRSPA